MALNKTQLKNRLVTIFSNPQTQSNVNAVAQQMADAIDEYVKTATIKYTSGLSAPNGAVTGQFNGNLE